MRWGIIGAGNIANKFAKTINMMEEGGEAVHLTAIAARDLTRAESFREQYKADLAFGSYEELYQCGDVEAVYIATPNNLHKEQVKACLLSGKHVLCEKPFTTSAEDAEELYALAKERGLFVMEAFWIAFLPALLKMQEILRSGEIGELCYARSEYGFIARGARKDRKFAAELGGGALLDIGIYNLGFMRMVMGETAGSFRGDVHINEYGTDDFSTLELHYPKAKETDITALVTTSIGLDIPRRAIIVGTKGNIEFTDFQQAEGFRVSVNEGNGYDVKLPFDYTGFEYEVREVLRCTEAKMSASDRFTPEQSLDTLRLMDQIRESWGMKFPFED